MFTNPELELVHAEARGCIKCALSKTRKLVVPGDGPANAEIMFIGEAPGYWENERGLPFVGQAGQLLEELLKGIGMERSDVFITNVLKCRPPNNRDPLPDEVAACRPYLDSQLLIINPIVVVTLGRHSSARFFPPKTMRDMHGRPVKLGNSTIMPTYHPAAILRQPGLRKVVDEDFQLIASLVDQGRVNRSIDTP
ncbi:MAG: uracil-DNA glycosylase family protein, partial [Chloroflexota bacterium]